MLMAMCGAGQVPEVKAEKKPKVEDDALKAKVELDDTLQHLHRAGGLPPNASKSDVSLHACEETAGAWRQNLEFSLLLLR